MTMINLIILMAPLIRMTTYTFLSHPKIDYTNNISERQLRKFKRKQKFAKWRKPESGFTPLCLFIV